MAAPRIACLVVVLAVTTWSCVGHVADISIAPGDVVRVTAPSIGPDESVGSVTALETDLPSKSANPLTQWPCRSLT
jgi:hypothetical protein